MEGEVVAKVGKVCMTVLQAKSCMAALQVEVAGKVL